MTPAEQRSFLKDHSRPNRREFVIAGALPVMGLGMSGLLAKRASAQSGDTREPPAKSVIFLFLSGGPSQIDMWDMKPDAPVEFRGEFKPIRTNAAGMQICEHMPRLARRADKFALLRSMTHKYNLHSQGHAMMLAGIDDVAPGFSPNAPTRYDWPSFAAVAGLMRSDRHGIPGSVVLPHPLVHRTGRVIPGQYAGWLGPKHDPWVANIAAKCTGYGACPDCFHFEGLETRHDRPDLFAVPDDLSLRAGIATDRFRKRVSLLEQVDTQRKDLENTASAEPLDVGRRRVVAMLTGGRVRDAFDFAREPDKLQDAYGRNQFGKSLLLARRLVEAGVSLVQVNLGNNETWDTHQSAFPLLKNKLLPTFDQCVSTLLDDLDARGLLETTMIVACGEFGRTPRISGLAGARLPGRDHWGASQSVFFAGGGVRGGTIVGATDRIGGHPVRDPYSPGDMAATLYTGLGLHPQAEIRDPLNRPFPISSGRVITPLFG